MTLWRNRQYYFRTFISLRESKMLQRGSQPFSIWGKVKILRMVFIGILPIFDAHSEPSNLKTMLFKDETRLLKRQLLDKRPIIENKLLSGRQVCLYFFLSLYWIFFSLALLLICSYSQFCFLLISLLFFFPTFLKIISVTFCLTFSACLFYSFSHNSYKSLSLFLSHSLSLSLASSVILICISFLLFLLYFIFFFFSAHIFLLKFLYLFSFFLFLSLSLSYNLFLTKMYKKSSITIFFSSSFWLQNLRPPTHQTVIVSIIIENRQFF